MGLRDQQRLKAVPSCLGWHLHVLHLFLKISLFFLERGEEREGEGEKLDVRDQEPGLQPRHVS